MVDQRRLGDIVPAFIFHRARHPGHETAFLAEHGVETRAQEEVVHQVEGGHDTARREPPATEVGHVNHLRMRHRLIGRHRHHRGPLGRELGVVRDHAVDIQPQRKPAAARHVEILVPRKPCPEPLAGRPRQELFRIERLVFIASRDEDARQFQVGTPAGIEELVERIACQLGLDPEERIARMVGIVGEKLVGIVPVIDMPAVGADQEDAAVGEGHPGSHREETFAVLDLPRVVDFGDVAERPVAEIPHGEIIGVVQEDRLPRIEIRAPADRTPRIDRPEVEVGAQLLPHASDRLVIDADVGLVEGRRGDIAADRDLEIGFGMELRPERIAFLHSVVCHMREIHREIAVRKHRIEVVAQFGEAHRALAPGGTAVYLHEVADIGLGSRGEPFEFIVVEDQRRAFGAELFAPLGIALGRPAFGNPLQNLRHDSHRIRIPGVHHGHRTVEVEHVDIHRTAYRDTASLGQVIVRIVHRQHESLVEDVDVLARRSVARRADAAHDQVGTEPHVERPPREVVVNTAVVQQHRIDFHRFEHQRDGHRRAHGFAQVAVAHHHRFAGVHIARHAEERHHQTVEVAACGRRGRREQLRKRHLDRRRRNQVRHAEAFARASQVQAHADKRRVMADLPVVGGIAGVDTPRHPLLDHARSDDLAHLGRGVARGIHGRDDRAHRGARHVIDRHAVLLEGFEHAYMVESLCAAAAHHDAHRAGTYSPVVGVLRPGSRRSEQQHRDK